jgi:2-polyprenyl-3-methyl-5-hydroxy-6-metoxy-1,4-benzoquinol methylase
MDSDLSDGYRERIESILSRLGPLRADPATRLRFLRELPRGDDDLWIWCLTEGLETDPRLAEAMPSLPPAEVQERFTGRSGLGTLQEAFGFKRTCLDQGSALDPEALAEARALDFGCGWGRISLALLNQIDPDHLVGVDVLEEAVEDCRQRGLPIRLEKVETLPPTPFDDQSFDLVVSYSVFSHLAERHFLAWMTEFHRLLRPGGTAFLTTRPREAIQWFEDLRQSGDVPDFARGAASSFKDTAAAFAAYDDGDFCFDPAGSGGDGLVGFYGESCVSLQYARRQLGSLFRRIDMVAFDQHYLFDQNLLILEK